MANLVYFDNNATTRPLDAVIAAMQPLLADAYANPSSVHQFGQAVRHRVETARGQVAELIGADPREIVFTSGGTESINLAIRGTLGMRPDRRRLVTSTVEHSATQRLGAQLAREGFEVVEVGVDADGRLNVDALAEAITADTALVSLLWANNETGVVFDVEAAAGIVAERGVPLHLDAVQAIGKTAVDIREVPCTLLSMSAHKFHGPKGAGALFMRKRARLRPLLVGGRQERDLRGGTENTAAIVGMGVAAEAAQQSGSQDAARVAGLRDRLEQGMLTGVAEAQVNGAAAPRIANTTNIGFAGVQAEALLILLSEQGICASAGAACSSGSLEPSHVLLAMGVPIEYAHGSLRFSLSRFTTTEEVDRVVAAMPGIVQRLAVLRG